MVVFGALLGVQTGRKVEVFNSFELIFEPGATPEAPMVMDPTYLKEKAEQLKKVFKELDLVGWYTTGGALTQNHVAIHEIMGSDPTVNNEAPLFMLLNPHPSRAERDLPIDFYESIREMAGDQQKTLFIESAYTLASEEAERIGVDHVAKVKASAAADTTSEVTTALSPQHSALDMLYTRISIIRDYLKAVKAGELPENHEVLRQISGLTSRLPIGDDEADAGHGAKDTNDVLLIAYLATITKGCSAMNEMLGKLSVVHDKSTMRRHKAFY